MRVRDTNTGRLWDFGLYGDEFVITEEGNDRQVIGQISIPRDIAKQISQTITVVFAEPSEKP